MEVKTIPVNIYKFLKDQTYTKNDGDTVQLMPGYAKALGFTSFNLEFHKRDGIRWFTTSEDLNKLHYSIMLQDNCMNIASFNDIQCLGNTICMLDNPTGDRYGVKRGNIYWGFSNKLVPETIPVSYLPKANEYPREDYGLNTMFWHNNEEVILPLYEGDAQTMYVTAKQREIINNDPELKYVFIKDKDTIYGHGLDDIKVETINGPIIDLNNENIEVENESREVI